MGLRDSKTGETLTENFIRELHKLILKEPYEVDAITPEGLPTKKKVNVGSYKSTPNHVRTRTGELFRFATPEETPALINDLLNWYLSKVDEKNINPILLAAEFHYKYIRIHPFDDGNGRTARILMNFILMQFGYPPVIIKTNDKENYFAALRQADAGLLEPFIEYISKNLNNSLELMIRGAKGEIIEEPDDLDKEIALLEQKLKTVAQPIEISKSQKAVLELYDNSISELIKKFIDKGEKFEKFYVKNLFYLNGVYVTSPHSKYDAILNYRNSIKEDISSIVFQFDYQAFNQTGFQEFNHISQIRFTFDTTRYRVGNSSGVTIEKLYGEQLDEMEINEIINAEIRRHKQFIESEIEMIKKKKL
ncbi:MAG: Fic family protein [Saprospiraceae bacterium]|nr:Fic family protein [Saprospiraceae bacterium]